MDNLDSSNNMCRDIPALYGTAQNNNVAFCVSGFHWPCVTVTLLDKYGNLSAYQFLFFAG